MAKRRGSNQRTRRNQYTDRQRHTRWLALAVTGALIVVIGGWLAWLLTQPKPAATPHANQQSSVRHAIVTRKKAKTKSASPTNQQVHYPQHLHCPWPVGLVTTLIPHRPSLFG